MKTDLRARNFPIPSIQFLFQTRYTQANMISSKGKETSANWKVKLNMRYSIKGK